MRNLVAIISGKFTYLVSQFFRMGAGGTWPGEIALSLSPGLLASFSKQLKKGMIVVAGTNGKTTTSLMIKQILEGQGFTTIHNATGANLLNGIASAFIKHADWLGKVHADWGIFEVDENSLPLLMKQLNSSSSMPQASRELMSFPRRRESIEMDPRGKPEDDKVSPRLRSDNKLIIVLLNLFRDQLDRYGEVDIIAEKWRKAFQKLSTDATLILNADDPLIAHLGIELETVISSGARNLAKRKNINTAASLPGSLTSFEMTKVVFFGVNDKTKFLKQKEHATDSIFCLNCGGRLNYEGIYFSHLGIWKCTKCGEKRSKPDISHFPSPLPGLYNQYNTLAAVGVAKSLSIKDELIKQSLRDFKPAFGRQEEFEIEGKKIKLFLSKNPAGFNQSLRTVIELGAKQLLLVLNDRIPDGRDVSWIWDVDFEMVTHGNHKIIVSGDRVYDLALRLKYSFKQYNDITMKQIIIKESLTEAVDTGLKRAKPEETLYILATYSAMLEVRKILTGKKIL